MVNDDAIQSRTARPAEAGAPAGPPIRRNAERVPLSLRADVRPSGGSAVPTELRDLSTHGFRMETDLELWAGAALWLRLPSLESRPAHVAWTRDEAAGCAFETPLHPAVFDMIVQKALAQS